MNNTKGYEINLATNEIILTKRFEKAASIYGSDEYIILTGLRKDFSDFSFRLKTIEKKENKVSYSGLSVYKMKAAIFYITNDKAAVETFEKYIKVYDGQKGKYATLKKLFLNTYKESYNALTADNMAEIDCLAKEYENVYKNATSKENVAA